jgi:cell wall-associated NlpC family hydrolase
MPRTRVLLSMLCVVFSLAVALVKPLGAKAGDGSSQTQQPPPSPANADPIVPPLPVLPARPRRRVQARLTFGRRVVDYARQFTGIRYVYGGSSPRSGFDCSGFVRYVFAHFGVSLAHSSYAQFGLGRRVARGSLRPGDLVFFDGLGHVGIYIGHGRFIHAPHSGTRVRVESLTGWYGSRYDGARRLRTT